MRNGRHLTATDDGELVADQPGPNGWEVKQTFRLVRCPNTLLVQHLHSGRYVQVDSNGTVALADDGSRVRVDVVSTARRRPPSWLPRADVTIVVAGNHPLVNGRETEDRETWTCRRRRTV